MFHLAARHDAHLHFPNFTKIQTNVFELFCSKQISKRGQKHHLHQCVPNVKRQYFNIVPTVTYNKSNQTDINFEFFAGILA